MRCAEHMRTSLLPKARAVREVYASCATLRIRPKHYSAHRTRPVRGRLRRRVEWRLEALLRLRLQLRLPHIM